jgi:hypothetical protein
MFRVILDYDPIFSIVAELDINGSIRDEIGSLSFVFAVKPAVRSLLNTINFRSRGAAGEPWAFAKKMMVKLGDPSKDIL